MIIDYLLTKRQMTKYRLAVDASIPHATLNDICICMQAGSFSARTFTCKFTG